MVRSRLLFFLGALGLLIPLATLSWWMRQVQHPAQGDLTAFLRASGKQPGQRVAVCLGASIIHGRVSVDFVEILRQRLVGAGWRFVNAGVNGDLAYNALQRLDAVVACQPDVVLILVGTNDVQASLSPRIGRLAVRSKKLPVTPSLEWYAANIRAIVAHLKAETTAAIALYELPVLGEDLDSRANAQVRLYNAALHRLAAEFGVTVLPLFTREAEYLRRRQGAHGRDYTDNPSIIVTASMQRYLLGRSFDAISASNGLLLSTDCIHLNGTAAALAADLAVPVLNAAPAVAYAIGS